MPAPRSVGIATVVAVALLSAACNTGTGAGPTTTEPAPPPVPDPTEPTTSTAPSTTTTTAIATTPLPVVVGYEGVLGWWDGSAWIALGDDTPVPAQGGEQYQLVLLDEPITTAIGSPPGPGCEFVEFSVSIDAGIPAPDTWPAAIPIAVSADWDVRPHLVQVLDPPPAVYQEVTAQLLAQRGINDPQPDLVQVIRTDLEGDGVFEVLIVAERQTNDSLAPAVPGDYSIAFLRRIVAGEVQTAILGEFVVQQPEAQDQIIALDVFRFAAVADLNGDDKMEIVLDAQYYEGGSVEVWEYVNDDLGPLLVLSTGCGV